MVLSVIYSRHPMASFFAAATASGNLKEAGGATPGPSV